MHKLNYISILFISLLLSLSYTSCSDKEVIPEPTPTPVPDPDPETDPDVVYADGFNFDLELIDADKPLTITFKAPSGTALYGTNSDLYLYSGAGTQWMGAPSSWTDNSSQYKMTAVSGKSNTWTITLSGSLRQFYNVSSATPFQTLNLIVRTADGSKQTGDYATLVQDANNAFTIQTTEEQAMPVSSTYYEGIHINNSSSVTLVLYDKDSEGNHKSHAYVMGSFNDWKLENRYQMKYDATKNCWWITLDALPANGFSFQYFVYSTTDGGSYLCDPYSEEVLERDTDSDFPTAANGRYVSYVQTRTDDYNWKAADFTLPDAESLVIYELLLRDFTSTHDLAGALQQLDYLKTLGVNAIQLMPVQEFEGNNSWGYNTSFYFALDASYGTRKDYKAFIDACHQAGMAVILDVVYNHTNNNNPFAKLYWDVFNDRPGKTNPWLNAETPHQKYVFSKDDFNHQSEQTQRFVVRNLEYLLETYRFDGFRFDFTKGFTQRKTTGDSDLSAYDASRVAVLRSYAEAVKSVRPDALVIMEHFCDSEEQELAQFDIAFWRNMNNAYAQAAMGWSDDSSFGGVYDSNYPAQFVGYMESHDEERMGYKQTQWGNGVLKTSLTSRMQQLATNAAFFLMVPGPKMIWQFGELGYDFSINSNVSGQNMGEDYRTAPKPIRWDYLDQSDRKALYDTYCKLLSLRNSYPQLFNSRSALQWNVATSDWSRGRSLYLRASSGEQLVVTGNFTNQSVSVNFPASTGVWTNYMTGEEVTVGTTVQLPANSFTIYTRF